MNRFVKRTLERAVKSAAQGVITAWIGVGAVADQVIDTGQVGDIYKAGPWIAGASMAILSILTSLASSGFGDSNDPSLVD